MDAASTGRSECLLQFTVELDRSEAEFMAIDRRTSDGG